MNVTGKSVINKHVAKIFAYTQFFKGSKPKNYLIRQTVMMLLLGIVILSCSVIIRNNGGDPTKYLFIYLGVIAFWVIFNSFGFVGLPKLQYKLLLKTAYMTDNYEFGDGTIRVITTSEAGECSGDVTIKYSVLEKVIETKDYLFVYVNLSNAYIVDKATLVNNPYEVLQTVLKENVKKYIRVGY